MRYSSYVTRHPIRVPLATALDREQHDFGRGRHGAEHEHLAHEPRDASRAEVHRGDDLPPDELLRACSVA